MRSSFTAQTTLTVCKPTLLFSFQARFDILTSNIYANMIFRVDSMFVQQYLFISEQFMYTSEQKYLSSLILNIEEDLPNSKSF